MIFIIEMIEQRILHYENLQNLKNIDVANSLKKFIIFVEKYVEFQNAKNRQILNFMKKDKRNEIIKIDDEKNEIKYIVQENIKKKEINEYDFIDSSDEFDDEIEIVKISND